MKNEIKILLQPVQTKRASEEIYEQIRQLILDGEIQPGERLPSERSMMEMMHRSRPTIREAMRMLEREGYIQTVAGRGSFVGRRSAELVREENLRRIEQLLGEALEIAGQSGIGLEQIFEMLRLLAETEEQKG